MFSRTGQYRLEIVASDGNGDRSVGPSELARAMGDDGARLLAGADNWRHHDVTRFTLRRHLDGLAALACRASRARSVLLTLYERRDLDDAAHVARSVRRDCE